MASLLTKPSSEAGCVGLCFTTHYNCTCPETSRYALRRGLSSEDFLHRAFIDGVTRCNHTSVDLIYLHLPILYHLQACFNSSSDLREGGDFHHCLCSELPQVCTGDKSHAREKTEHLYPTWTPTCQPKAVGPETCPQSYRETRNHWVGCSWNTSVCCFNRAGSGKRKVSCWFSRHNKPLFKRSTRCAHITLILCHDRTIWFGRLIHTSRSPRVRFLLGR